MKKDSFLLLFLFVLIVIVGYCPLVHADYDESMKALNQTGTGEWGPTLLKDIPLEWKPTNTIVSYEAVDLTIYNKVQFEVKPFSDARAKPAEIGKNIENKKPGKELLVTTKDSVADWLTDKFVKNLSELNIRVSKGNSTSTLEADIVKFFVIEDSAYRGEVALKVRLKSKSGELLWEGMTSGKASRFGKSYKAENYYEALSNSVINMVHGLLRSEAFVRAVAKSL